MISRRSSSASGSRGAGRLLARATAVAVTCASVALSGSIAASATTTKTAPATQAATSPASGGEKKLIPYPRLDSTNIITAFDLTAPPAAAAALTPTASTTFIASARRGHVFVYNGTNWVDLTTLFAPGYLYDVTLAAAPSSPLSIGVVGGVPTLTTAAATGIPAGRLRVTVRKADGAILYSDCNVASLTGVAQTLTPANCTAGTRIA